MRRDRDGVYGVAVSCRGVVVKHRETFVETGSSPVGPTNDPFESRGAQAVDLRRKTANSPSGIYRCDIAVNASEPSAKQTFYVGIYVDGGMYSRTRLYPSSH